MAVRVGEGYTLCVEGGRCDGGAGIGRGRGVCCFWMLCFEGLGSDGVAVGVCKLVGLRAFRT